MFIITPKPNDYALLKEKKWIGKESLLKHYKIGGNVLRALNVRSKVVCIN